MTAAHVSIEPRFRGGEGAPLLLLHAAFLSWRLWEPLLPYLTPSRDVIAPTLVGHYGAAPWTLELGWVVDAATDEVARLLDEFGVERPDIVGNSIGGFIALELARRGRARRVVGIGPMGMYDEEEGDAIARSLRRYWLAARRSRRFARVAMRSPGVRRRAMAPLAAHGERVPPELAAHLTLANASNELPMWESMRMENGTLRRIENPEEIDVPVLILWGDRDPYASRAQMKRYVDRLPNARLVELPGLAHSPQLDEPERIAHRILDFTNGGAS